MYINNNVTVIISLINIMSNWTILVHERLLKYLLSVSHCSFSTHQDFLLIITDMFTAQNPKSLLVSRDTINKARKIDISHKFSSAMIPYSSSSITSSLLWFHENTHSLYSHIRRLKAFHPVSYVYLTIYLISIRGVISLLLMYFMSLIYWEFTQSFHVQMRLFCSNYFGD